MKSLQALYLKRGWKIVIIGVSIIVFLWVGLSFYFHLTLNGFVKNGIRVVAAPILASFYSEDEEAAARIRSNYWIGVDNLVTSSPLESWKRIEEQLTGFRFLCGNGIDEISRDIPFIFESMDAPHLIQLREHYKLGELIKDAIDEYDAMLRLAEWLGTRWDHGGDPVPGVLQFWPPVAVIQAGERGSKFWCEIAAKVTVYAATTLGWKARLVTASRDGYTWEHAVAELWSNQYAKWFVIDADFNVVYEANQAPLSAFELCHDGPELQKTAQLRVRAIAPPKPSLPRRDLLPFYRYIHIDLRNDWYSRRLRQGSPAGGDLATWWTARPSLSKILTAKVHVDERARFNWPVNTVNIYAFNIETSQEKYPTLHIRLAGYCPSFRTFQTAIDDEPWHETKSGEYSFRLSQGIHSIKARVVTAANHVGPIFEVRFHFLNNRDLSFSDP